MSIVYEANGFKSGDWVVSNGAAYGNQKRYKILYFYEHSIAKIEARLENNKQYPWWDVKCLEHYNPCLHFGNAIKYT